VVVILLVPTVRSLGGGPLPTDLLLAATALGFETAQGEGGAAGDPGQRAELAGWRARASARNAAIGRAAALEALRQS
jgi:hypothetical protein